MKFCEKCNNIFPDDVERCLIDGTALRESRDPMLGKLIGGCYRVISKLASGGMGDVYRAKHEYLNREVAVKILKSTLGVEEEYRQRTMREARICATVEHVHIVKAFDLVISDGLVCMVMELLEGETLKTRLRRDGPMDVAGVLRIMSMISDALARAHSLDVVHRDIKPSNIFLARYMGSNDFVKLLDFGIAFALRENRLTRQGAVVGTPPYMSPELFKANEPSKASDVYSLACVIYQMLTGKTPFHSTELSEIVAGHLKRLPEPIRTLRPEVPVELEVILLKMLEKDPDDRYSDAFELLHELETSGLHTMEFEERPSLTELEDEPDTPTERRSEWESFFGEEQQGTSQSESFQSGYAAATELIQIEKQKKAIVEKIEALQAQRSRYQKNISMAVRTLRSDLSRLRDEHEQEQMEYLKIRMEREFLEKGVLDVENDLHAYLTKRVARPERKPSEDGLFRLAVAGDTARRYSEVIDRIKTLKHGRSTYKDRVKDMKFQIVELSKRLKQVEDEFSTEYDQYRQALDEISERGERMRLAAAEAAIQVHAEGR